SILFISHDLAVVGQISDRLYVLNRGRVVEQGVTAHVLTTPDDPYTRTLVAAARRDTV
ncbi:MAG: ABC transporter ATP-binding protein, partial [Cellulomonadaceae bacterium]|nr:ABC transporter ATP-binding protein [Cellulomonadaceae bacterium]